MIECVADDSSFGIDKGRQQPHDRGVGGTENHGRFAVVESGQSLFQLNMGLIGPADKPHGPRAGAVRSDSRLFGFNEPFMAGQTEIGIGIHPDKRFITLTLDEVSRPLAILGWFDGRNDLLTALQCAFGVNFRQFIN